MTEEILSFEIVIDAKLSEETKQNLDELKNSKEEKTSASDDAASLLESEGELTGKQLDEIRSTISEELGGLDKGQLMEFGRMGKNPKGAVTQILQKIGGSGIAKFLGPIGIAIIAAEVSKEIIKMMSVKGGPLNRDWRRFIESEVQVGLSRVQQKERELGISQTILTQVVGFSPNNENWTHNSLYLRNDQRVARIGISDRAAGVSMFIGR